MGLFVLYSHTLKINRLIFFLICRLLTAAATVQPLLREILIAFFPPTVTFCSMFLHNGIKNSAVFVADGPAELMAEPHNVRCLDRAWSFCRIFCSFVSWALRCSPSSPLWKKNCRKQQRTSRKSGNHLTSFYRILCCRGNWLRLCGCVTSPPTASQTRL